MCRAHRTLLRGFLLECSINALRGPDDIATGLRASNVRLVSKADFARCVEMSACARSRHHLRLRAAQS